MAKLVGAHARTGNHFASPFSPHCRALPPFRTTGKPVHPFPSLAMAGNGNLTEHSAAALPSPPVSPYRRFLGSIS
jgi:hypothetical protein